MNILVLVLDRLHAGYLGAYGNAWVETPALDRLAAESFVFDQALSFSPELASYYRAVWQGRDPLDAQEKETAAGGGHCVKPLVDRFEACGLETKLLADDPAIAALPTALGDHQDVADVENGDLLPRLCGHLCESADQTHLATCFTRLISTLTTLRKPFGFWCHLSSLGKIWDAPLPYRARYAEEGDPEPSESDEPVATILPPDFDPDELLVTTWSYAANVAVLDECIGALMEYLDESGLARETALVLTSSRSYPLGEHRRVGDVEPACHEELVHVPLLIRMPDGTGAAGRSSGLVTPLDLFATLSELAGMNSEENLVGESLLPIVRHEKESTERDRVLLGLPGGELAIRTTYWHMRLTDPPELYVKPDDRWEANNVADRLPEEVEALRAVAEKDTPLPEILCYRPE
ncbi:MAG: sulfatase-like hydrolase/transferase [Planctomycetia bacterium]|jgi:hypothetical protein